MDKIENPPGGLTRFRSGIANPPGDSSFSIERDANIRMM